MEDAIPAEPLVPQTLASDSERESTCQVLQDACVDGRLTLEEFSQRVELAMVARTHSQLQETTHDLPAVSVWEADHRGPVSSSIAILSSVDRKGHWRIGKVSQVVAVMGECKLDLRGAAISAQVTTIEAQVVMGNLEVIVPTGVQVDVDMLTVLGSRSMKLNGPPPLPGAPIIHIKGRVLAGSVKISDRANKAARISGRLADTH
jgi:Domain of unknown function (DUF1707)/Cell wall-active antibiotics response 4TMS YvqF